MRYIDELCADAGSENCPCILAETCDCLVCSRLSGLKRCDCNWCGVCIYNEFIQNGSNPSTIRRFQKLPIVEKKWYAEDLLLIKLSAEAGFLSKAIALGAFVIAKGLSSDYYSVPLSVLRCDFDLGQLHLLVKVISAKTKKIAEAKDFLDVKGVYRNGLLGEGLKSLDKSSKPLIIAKGTAFAAAPNIINLCQNTTMIIDEEKVTSKVIDDYIGKKVDLIKCQLHSLIDDNLTEKKLPEPLSGFDDYSHIVILASDYYIKNLTVRLNIPDEKLVYSNNYHMCCGEGICGACSCTDSDGEDKKMCKHRK